MRPLKNALFFFVPFHGNSVPPRRSETERNLVAEENFAFFKALDTPINGASKQF
jgi:hypothetical protein